MLVPVSWLKAYTELDVPMDVFCERMVMSGSNIEAVEEKGAEFENVRIGRVLRVEPHPNADRLVVVYVDVEQTNRYRSVPGRRTSSKAHSFRSRWMGAASRARSTARKKWKAASF